LAEYRIDTEKVKELSIKGVSASDIAKTQGVTRRAIEQFLSKHRGEIALAKEFKEKQTDILAAEALKKTAIINSVLDGWIEDPEKLTSKDARIKKEILHTLQGGRHYDILDTQLLEGRATGIVDVNVLHSLVNKLPDLQAQIAAYEAEFVVDTPTNKEIASPDRQPDAE